VAGGLPCLNAAVSWLSCRVRRVCVWDGEMPDGAASHVLFAGEVVDAGEAPDAGGPSGENAAVLRMEDTRMNYGG
jgi:flavin reductase (DIM6/NTAB) family NADH-FMN oxidoreductase RutF